MKRKKLTVYDYLGSKGKRQLSALFVHSADEAKAAEAADKGDIDPVVKSSYRSFYRHAENEYSLLINRINGDLRTNNELSFNFGSRHNSGFGLALSANGGILSHFDGLLFDASVGAAVRVQWEGSEGPSHAVQLGYQQNFSDGDRDNYQMLNHDGNDLDNNRLGIVFLGYGQGF